jgi:hypothetical protein
MGFGRVDCIRVTLCRGDLRSPARPAEYRGKPGLAGGRRPPLQLPEHVLGDMGFGRVDCIRVTLCRGDLRSPARPAEYRGKPGLAGGRRPPLQLPEHVLGDMGFGRVDCIRVTLCRGDLRSPARPAEYRGKPGLAAVEDRPYNCLNMCLEIWALDGWTAYGSRCVGATCEDRTTAEHVPLDDCIRVTLCRGDLRSPARPAEYRGKPGLAGGRRPPLQICTT